MLGEVAVHLARAAVRSEVLVQPLDFHPSDPAFSEPSGVFVTLETFPAHDLRGCIGYPMPVLPMGEAIEASARSACHDPRFMDLRPDELGGITVEVTLLSVPEPVRADGPDGIRDSVVIGRDGLIIECMGRRGLLLPQVPVEWGWDATEFLEHLSMKAGLPPYAWRLPEARISSFSGEIYHESAPCGDIVRG